MNSEKAQWPVQTLGPLHDDPYFLPLCEGNKLCTLSAWIVEFSRPNKGRWLNLAYAWIIQSIQNTVGYSESNIYDWKAVDCDTKFRMHRIAITSEASSIYSMIEIMLNGSTLQEAIDDSPINAKSRFGELTLGASLEEISNKFALGTRRLLETQMIISELNDSSKPNSSPSRENIAFCLGLVRLDKTTAISRADDASLESEGLAKGILSTLSKETGLNFTDSDANRVGDIEWIAFPAANAFETSEILTRSEFLECGTNLYVVARRGSRFAPNDRLLVRCRFYCSLEIVNDQIVEANLENEVVFNGPPHASRFLITIWERSAQGPGNICYEELLIPIKEIGLNIGMVGMTGVMHTSLSKKFEEARASVRARVAKIRCVSKISYSKSTVRIVDSPLLADEARHGARALARRLFPNKSGAHFFRNGWGATGPGELEFVEWIHSVRDRPGVSKLVLLDPFFDAEGIAEFLAKTRSVATEYIILTNSQVVSKDDRSSTIVDPTSAALATAATSTECNVACLQPTPSRTPTSGVPSTSELPHLQKSPESGPEFTKATRQTPRALRIANACGCRSFRTTAIVN